MQAYIKNDKLIINDMIQENEKQDFINFINNSIKYGILFKPLYDIKGDISGIEFNTKKGE